MAASKDHYHERRTNRYRGECSRTVANDRAADSQNEEKGPDKLCNILIHELYSFGH